MRCAVAKPALLRCREHHLVPLDKRPKCDLVCMLLLLQLLLLLHLVFLLRLRLLLLLLLLLHWPIKALGAVAGLQHMWRGWPWEKLQSGRYGCRSQLRRGRLLLLLNNAALLLLRWQLLPPTACDRRLQGDRGPT